MWHAQYTDTSAYRRQRVSRVSLQESNGVACSISPGAVLLKHNIIVCRQPANVWQWLLSKKVVATVWPLNFDTKSEQSDCNKCIGDDTKAAARQSLNCIKNKKK